MVVVTCRQCGQKYALPDEAAGTTKKCRKCQKPIDVPRPESSSSTPPRRLVLRPPRRQRPVFWMMIGAAITAVTITASHFIWHRLRPPLENTTQLYRPIPVDSELVHLDAAGQMYNETISAIVFIEKYKDGRCRGHGTGFFLSPGNKIVTNYHVIADADYALIETYWRQQLRVDRYLAVDRYRDLAILPSPRSIKPDSLQIATRPHAVGERVYTMGSPKSVRFGISEGVIVSMGNLRGSFPGSIVQCDISAAPGASGSPVLNSDGQVLGILTRGSDSDRKYSFAVHSDELQKLLAKKMSVQRFGPWD